MLAMSVTIVEDGRPTYWAGIRTNNKLNPFQLVPWPPQPEDTFHLGAPFIHNMQKWIRDNFPSANFALREITSFNSTARPAGR